MANVTYVVNPLTAYPKGILSNGSHMYNVAELTNPNSGIVVDQDVDEAMSSMILGQSASGQLLISQLIYP